MVTASAPARSFSTSVDIPPDRRAKVVKILNQHLADAFHLQSQVKQAHWNVKGSDFWQFHKLFDEVAERRRRLGRQVGDIGLRTVDAVRRLLMVYRAVADVLVVLGEQLAGMRPSGGSGGGQRQWRPTP